LQAASLADAEENAVQLSPLFSTAARAPQPVWTGSVAVPVSFSPSPRNRVAGWFKHLWAWEYRPQGILWRAVLAVYRALAFEFLNYASGRLDPGLDAIARRSRYCRRTVVTALKVLRDLGVISWVRRCDEYRDAAGRSQLRQLTNAYTLHPPSQWLGFTDPSPPPPPPAPGTWGDHPPLPSALEIAMAAVIEGHPAAAVAALSVEHLDPLARALAELGRLVEACDATGVQGLSRNPTPDSNLPIRAPP
jgi:hypothetical protein